MGGATFITSYRGAPASAGIQLLSKVCCCHIHCKKKILSCPSEKDSQEELKRAGLLSHGEQLTGKFLQCNCGRGGSRCRVSYLCLLP